MKFSLEIAKSEGLSANMDNMVEKPINLIIILYKGEWNIWTHILPSKELATGRPALFIAFYFGGGYTSNIIGQEKGKLLFHT